MRISAGVIWLALSGAAFITVVAAGKNVKASFKLTNEDYIEELRDHNSDEYKDLKKKVEDEVEPVLKNENAKISGFHVEFFRNGSGLVIVDSLVLTTQQNQKKANKLVLDALKTLPHVDPSSASVGVRLCVPAQGKCAMLKENEDTKDLSIICIEARDRYECLQMLNNREVDLVHGNAADVFLANDLYGDQLRVVAETRDGEKEDEEYQYKAVAVVRRSTINGSADLKGSKSCHTGYGKTSGWYVPISKLIENGEMIPDCSGTSSVVEKDLRTVSSYFGEACIPGKWVPLDDTNTRLKSDYSNLCSLCKDPTKCDKNDDYAGYEGALKCLIESNADVAWTKLDEVDKFFDSNNHLNKADFGLICYDGRIVDIGSSESDDCYWAARPWPAWLTWRTRPTHSDKTGLVRTLDNLVDTLQTDWLTWQNWAEDVFEINENSIIKKLMPRLYPEEYLNQAGYYTTISQVVCPATPVRLCVVGAEAEQKCKELGEVLKSRRVRPDITCVKRKDEATCVDAIAEDAADIITLDGGDMFSAYSDDGLIPVISEVYGALDVSYYAVAVVKKGSTISSLEALQNKKSCHTGIYKSAGWNVPVITLLDAGLLNHQSHCDYAELMGNFFNKSCAPGALEPKYDPNGDNPPSLCDLCVGDASGLDKCARNSNERFYGYTGAFRCLVEGGGDVAFIKSTTVPDNTGKPVINNGKWNQDLVASDYQLLCKDGTKQDVSAYESCHWASVPSHKVVTRDDGVLQEEQVRILLLRASETLPLGQNVFAMFGEYDGDRDVIFKSSTTSLVNLNDQEFLDLRSGIYWQALTELGPCP